MRNVFEWCWDWSGASYAGGTDPHGVTTGTGRVVRGGSWGFSATYCRSADHFGNYPSYANSKDGFRAVLASG